MKTVKFLTAAILTTTLFISCDKDDDKKNEPVNEEELITTVKVTLKDGAETITLTSKDLDGDGANQPQVTVSGDLKANTSYSGTVDFLDETKNPAAVITEEIEEEDVDHQIFFQAVPALGDFTYNDFDTNTKPVGIEFTYNTKDATSGTITVTLRHTPNKSAVGVSTGDITNAGGSTDAEVVFPVKIN
jgi:hypothetical protein